MAAHSPRFDTIYGSNDNALYFPKPSRLLSRLVVENGFQTGFALDIGCGDGRNTLFLASMGFSVTAVDISHTGIAKLQRQIHQFGFSNVRCCVNDVRLLEYNTLIYDLIVMSTILDHLDRNEIQTLVRKVKEWVKPDGYIYASAFTVDDPGFKIGNPEKTINATRDIIDVSPTAEFVKTYFGHKELMLLFDEFTVVSYEETFEKDLSHGYPHHHGIARLLCRR